MRLFNSHWHECSTVTGKIVQQWLARLFNSHWHDYSTVTGMIDQQWLARFFNSHWYNSSTVTGRIIQQSRADFSFFYAGRILQQWRSLLKNRAMYQEFGRWSVQLNSRRVATAKFWYTLNSYSSTNTSSSEQLNLGFMHYYIKFLRRTYQQKWFGS